MGDVQAEPIRVWVVDDQELNRRLVANILSHAGGFEILGSSECADPLLGHLDAGLPAPDVVLADVHVPGEDLASLSEQLSGRGARVLHLTGIVDAAMAIRLLAGGARGAITKPIRHAELIAAIRAVAAGLVVLPGDSLGSGVGARPGPIASPTAPRPPRTPAPGPELVERLLDELRAADDLARLFAHLASSAAHAWDTQLTAIRGYVELAEAGVASADNAEIADALAQLRTLDVPRAFEHRRLRRWLGPWRSRAVGSDLIEAATEGAEHHFGIAAPRVRLRMAAPLPVAMDGRRTGNLVWAAVRAVAAAASGQPVCIEARAVPAARATTDEGRFGRIRVSASLGAPDSPLPEWPDWSPPFVATQLEPGDAAAVMAGARDGEAIVDLWMPLVEKAEAPAAQQTGAASSTPQRPLPQLRGRGSDPDDGLAAAVVEELEAADELSSMLRIVVRRWQHDSIAWEASGIHGFAVLALDHIGPQAGVASEALGEIAAASERLIAALADQRQFMTGRMQMSPALGERSADLCAAADLAAAAGRDLGRAVGRTTTLERMQVSVNAARLAAAASEAVAVVAAASNGPLLVETRVVPSSAPLDGVRYARLRVEAASSGGGPRPFPLWRLDRESELLHADDCAEVLAGTVGDRVRVDLWAPLLEADSLDG